jgi:serine/threonine-protein kinase
MPPEQALGRVEQLGPRSDVYSLGAVLYHLLTGQAPFSGPDVQAVLERVVSAAYPPARQVNRQVPAALEGVCRKAMSLRREDRYESARALAEELEHWLAGEPVNAYREPVPARVQRWGRRHRTLVSSLFVLLVVGALALGVGLWAVTHQRDRALEAERRAQTNLEAAERAAAEARVNRRQAEANFDVAKKAVDGCFRFAEPDPLLEPPVPSRAFRQQDNLLPVRRLLLKQALPLYDALRAQRPQDREMQQQHAEHLWRAGSIDFEMGQFDEAVASYDEAVRTSSQLAREAGSRTERARFEAGLAKVHLRLGVLYAAQGKSGLMQENLNRAHDLYAGLSRAFPDDAAYTDGLALTALNLGNAQYDQGNLPEARKHYRQGQQLYDALADRYPDEPRYQAYLGLAWFNLGQVQAQTGRSDDALTSFKRTITLLQRVRAALAEGAGKLDVRLWLRNAHGARALVLHRLRRHAEAVPHWDQVIDLDDGRRRPGYRTLRAEALVRAGKYQRAMEDADRLRDEKLPGTTLYRLGRICALSSRLASEDSNLVATARARQAAAHARQALAYLERARQQDFFRDPRRLLEIQKEPDLDFLRKQDAFKKWLKAVEADVEA